MTMPAAVSFGQVYWSGIAATADGPDAGANPDPVGVTGTVTFTPSPREPLTANPGTPGAVSVFPLAATYSVTDGTLLDSEGRTLVSLVATTATDVTPVGWTWLATYRLNAIGGSSPARGSFSFSLAAGEVLNLANAMPVASSNGVAILQGPPGASYTEAQLRALFDLWLTESGGVTTSAVLTESGDILTTEAGDVLALA